jgi:hypothetical protein
MSQGTEQVMEDIAVQDAPGGGSGEGTGASGADAADGVPLSGNEGRKGDPEEFLESILRLGFGGGYDKALAKLEKFLSREPDNLQAMGGRALLLLKMGRFPESVDASYELVARYPEDKAGFHILAMALMRSGDLETARETLEHILEQEPGEARLWKLLGIVYGRLGHPELSFECYDRAIGRVKGPLPLPEGEPVSDGYGPSGGSGPHDGTGGATGPEPSDGPEHTDVPEHSDGPGRSTGSERSTGPNGSARTEHPPSPEGDPDRRPLPGSRSTPESPAPAPATHAPPGGLYQPNVHLDTYSFELALQELEDRGGGGCFSMVDAPFMLPMTREVLRSCLGLHEIDGVVVCGDRPPNIYRRIIGSQIKCRYPPVFVDLFHALGGYGGSEDEEDVIRVPEPFGFDSIEEAVDEALQMVAVRYEGQRHFVLFDNIASLLPMFSEKEVVRYFKGQGRRMEELGILGIFMVAEGAMALSWVDRLRKFGRS